MTTWTVPLWPEAPAGAEYIAGTENNPPFWHVWGLPPEPWPERPAGGWPRATFGPPGTSWGPFSADQVVSREGWTSSDNVLERLVKLLRKLGVRSVDGSGTWTVPGEEIPPPLEELPPVTIKIIRATIHGRLGLDEEVAHVLHLRTKPTPDVDQDAAALKTLGGQIADRWNDFLGQAVTPYGQGTAVNGYLPLQLQYDEIRIAYLSVSPGMRPTYLIPTQYVPYGARRQPLGRPNTNATLQNPLPYEVAMCMSLGTEFRGPRHRGRTYLGPWLPSVMGADGQFSTLAQDIGRAFGNRVIAGISQTTGADVHVLSTKFGESYPVSGVRVGLTPDSQRRRRSSRPEAYSLVYGTPVGSPYAAPTGTYQPN